MIIMFFIVRGLVPSAKMNNFNPLPLDQVYPLYSRGTRLDIRPTQVMFTNVGAT